MVIKRVARRLITEATGVIARPAEHGLPPRVADAPDLWAVTEALVPAERWCWLTYDDLFDCWQRRDQFAAVEPATILGPPEPPGDLPAAVFLPLEPTHDELSPGPPFRLFDSLDRALRVAACRRESFEGARVGRIAVTPGAIPPGWQTRQDGLILVSEMPDRPVDSLSSTEIRAALPSLFERMRFHDALYMAESPHQAAAIRYLYEHQPQRVIETRFVAHLFDPDPDIRCNVLCALGAPAYMTPFVPGVPLPPREQRLEPVVLAPETMRLILLLARDEHDQGVLDWIVCTLKSQTYGGKLLPVVPEVLTTLTDLADRLSDPQSVKDCLELRNELAHTVPG